MTLTASQNVEVAVSVHRTIWVVVEKIKKWIYSHVNTEPHPSNTSIKERNTPGHSERHNNRLFYLPSCALACMGLYIPIDTRRRIPPTKHCVEERLEPLPKGLNSEDLVQLHNTMYGYSYMLAHDG